MSKLASGRAECQDRINAALSTFGSWAGNGAAFTLALSPSDEALDAAVAVDSSWAEGLLYTSIAELLEQMNTNLQAQPAAVGSAVAKAASKRVLQISIDESSGGLMTGVSVFRDGRLDLVFRAQSLKTNQYGWSEIGNDIAETVKAFKPPAAPAPVKAAPAPTTTVATPGRSARGPPPTAGARGGAVSAAPKAAAPPKAAPAPASSFGAMGDALSANLAERQSAIDAQLAKLAAFVGDGAPWKVQLAASAASMDASVTREASYMENLLFGTVVEFLEFINSNVRRYATGELLAQASSARTIVFEFVDTDDCPRQYLGRVSSGSQGAKLHFVVAGVRFQVQRRRRAQHWSRRRECW
jgi:hypothetical protein